MSNRHRVPAFTNCRNTEQHKPKRRACRTQEHKGEPYTKSNIQYNCRLSKGILKLELIHLFDRTQSKERTPNELFRLDFDQLIKNQISKYNKQSMCQDKPDVTCLVVQRRLHSIRAVSWRRLWSSYISCGRSSEVISTHVVCTETLTKQAFISCSHVAHISVDPACLDDTSLSSDDTSWS